MSYLDNVIKGKRTIVKKDKEFVPRNALNFAFGIDSKFARPMGVAMTSIILNNQERDIVFHIFTDGLQNSDLERLNLLVQEYDAVVIIYQVDVAKFKNLRATFQWPHAIYYRFVAGKELYGLVDKILYLDADVICLHQLQTLFDMDLEGKTVAAVKDEDICESPAYMKKINMAGNVYFNSGVLYIDVNQWNSKSISERAFELLDKNQHLYDFPDQDVLNVLLNNDTYLINLKYNFLYKREHDSEILPTNEIKIIHYAANPKPWHVWYRNSLKCLFDKYSKLSHWDDVPPDQPGNYKEMKMMARTMQKEGFFKEALLWYWRYCKYKFREKTSLALAQL